MNIRYKITIEYDGTHFSGWQIQKDAATVQGAIQSALYQIFQTPIIITGAGRTDAGVHAFGQVAHFDAPRDIEPPRLQLALNHFLNRQAISIVECAYAAPDFHARFDAKLREYEYKVVFRAAPLAINAFRALHVYQPCDVTSMEEAIKLLIGTHDFSAFRDSQCQAKTPIKTMKSAFIEKQGEALSFHFAAPSFLHHQVRNMVGTLLYVGMGKLSVARFQEVFAAKKRTLAGPTILPHGLYFKKVHY